MLIKIDNFKGTSPATSPRRLGAGFAQIASNVRLTSGTLEALKNAATVTPSLLGILMKSLFLYRGTHWFQFTDDVDLIKAPISGDTLDRVIYSGAGEPRITDSGIATGTDLKPSAYYTLGVPSPLAVPVVSITGAGAADGTVEYRSYCYTYVNSYGQEGPPSPFSETQQFQVGQVLEISGMSGAPTGSYNMVTKRIYRANAGASSAEFQYVGEVGIGTTTFSDTVLAENLGEVLATKVYDPPPAGMKGLIELPNGGAAGFLNNEVLLSEPYACHAWPYIYTTHDPIVGLGAYGNSILIMTTGNPYVLTGAHPSSMTMEKLEISYPCVGKRGIVDLGYAVAFPSPNGLIVIGMDIARNVIAATADRPALLTDEQWQALNPETMIGVAWQGSYIGFHAGGAVIIDPRKDYLTNITTTATAAWTDPVTDKLYLATGAVGSQNIVQFDGAETYLPYTWRSGVFVAPSLTNFGCAQVLAQAYPLTFKLLVDGAEKHTQTVGNSLPFRLPGGFAGREFVIELSSTTGVEVNAVFMAHTIAELTLA